MRAARTLAAVLRHEWRLLLASPVAWGFLVAGAALAGLVFTRALTATGEASLGPALPDLGVVLLICLPAVTARQLAEEERSGAAELWAALPVPVAVQVVGKWLAAWTLGLLLLLATAPFPLVLLWFGDPDPGALLTAYLGLAGCCAVFAAGGLLASATTREPAVAAVAGVALLLPSWLASAAADWWPEAVRPLAAGLSFVEHLRGAARGVVDTGELAWFAGVTAVLLLWTTRLVESRRWR